jgi:hypothetical protein
VRISRLQYVVPSLAWLWLLILIWYYNHISDYLLDPWMWRGKKTSHRHGVQRFGWGWALLQVVCP